MIGGSPNTALCLLTVTESGTDILELVLNVGVVGRWQQDMAYHSMSPFE